MPSNGRSWWAARILLPALLGAGLAALPAAPATAATVVTEIYHVPSVDGSSIRVEVTRDTDFARVPVILTYSPYNTLSEPSPSDDAYAARYVPLGYARAVADLLGTRGSTGCWDYGGLKEQQSGVDVVKFLAHQPWANGRVAMIGGSYEGTTATMVAARGAEVPELVGIVPISAISHWYGYAYNHGVRFFLNSNMPTDEGFDTPLAFDYGFNRTVAPDPDDPNFVATLQGRFGPCEFESVEHTQEGYSRQPDYDAFWRERSYRKDAARFKAAVLLAHGWQDYNVKQEEAIALWKGLRLDNLETARRDGVPFKIMYLTQGTHGGGTSGEEWLPLLDAFFAHTLHGVDNGIDDRRTSVITRGRTVDGAGAYLTLPPRTDEDFTPPSTKLHLHLHRSFDQDVPGVVVPPPGTGETGTLKVKPADDGFFTYVDTGTATEETSLRDPLNAPGHGYYSLFYQSAPLTRDMRTVGSAVLDAWVRTQQPGQHLTPLLVDVLPNGQLRLVERGFLNLDYRDGLDKARPLAAGEWGHGKVEFLPQDFTFPAGHRIGLIVQSSNTVWAVPGAAGTVNIAHGKIPNTPAQGTKLILPVHGSNSGLFA